MAATNKSTERDGDDVGALISAAERKQSATASTQKKIQVVNQDNTSTECRKTPKRKRLPSNENENHFRKKLGRDVRLRKACIADGCTNPAKKGGVCFRHGAKRKQCSRD